MPVQLNQELEELVQQSLRSGKYRDEDDVLREALTLLQQRDQLRSDIAEGLAELNRGERFGAEELFSELRDRSQTVIA